MLYVWDNVLNTYICVIRVIIAFVTSVTTISETDRDNKPVVLSYGARLPESAVTGFGASLKWLIVLFYFLMWAISDRPTYFRC